MNDRKKKPITLLGALLLALVITTATLLGLTTNDDTAIESAATTTADRCLPWYCDRYPERCEPCEKPPCGKPIAYVCCTHDGACVAVNTYGECGEDGEIFYCEDGYQGVDPATGKPYVICFDE